MHNMVAECYLSGFRAVKTALVIHCIHCVDVITYTVFRPESSILESGHLSQMNTTKLIIVVYA